MRLSSFGLKLCYYDVALDYITCHVVRDHVDAAHVDLVGLPTTETPPGLHNVGLMKVSNGGFVSPIGYKVMTPSRSRKPPPPMCPAEHETTDAMKRTCNVGTT